MKRLLDFASSSAVVRFLGFAGILGLTLAIWRGGASEARQEYKLDSMHSRLLKVEACTGKLDTLIDRLDRKMAADSAQAAMLRDLMRLLNRQRGSPLGMTLPPSETTEHN